MLRSFSATQAGPCVGSPVLSHLHAGEGKLSCPELLGELSLLHMGFACPEVGVLPTSLAPLLWAPSGIPWGPPAAFQTIQKGPSFSQKSLADLGTPAETHVGLTLSCPVTCSCPSRTNVAPGARAAPPEDVRGGQATLPSLWLCLCGAHVCPVQ